MKQIIILLCLVCSWTCFALDITTRAGTTYRNCEVTKVDPDSLTIRHSDGVAKIQFEDIPKSLLTQHHYDPAKVAAYRKTFEDAKAASAAKVAEQQKEIESIRAKAQQQEEERQQWALAQRQRQAEAAAELRKAQRAQSGLTFSPTKQDGLRLEHESYGKLLSEAKTKATNLNYNEERTNSLISSVPAGGILTLHIERSTIGAANTEYFTVIVFDRTGKEILRRIGGDSIAEVPNSNGKWWNLMVIRLPEISEMPIKIRVVDTLSNKASEFNAE